MENKILNLVFGSVLISLAGCASRPFDYEGIAHRAAYAGICQREGLITADQFSSYTSFQLNEYASQWSHDQGTLKAIYLDQLEINRKFKINSERDRDELKMDCANISTVAKRVNPNNAVRQQSSPAYQYKKPLTTDCMTTNGLTTCTTN